MNYYKYVCDSDYYNSLLLEDVEQYADKLYQFVGVRLTGTWSPLRGTFYKTRYNGDFPHLTSHVPVFSEKATDILYPLIGDAVELLPLECSGCGTERYFAVHVLALIDCLDYDRTQITRDPSGGIIFIDQYAFIEERVLDRHIFRIAEAPLKDVIVSSEFKSLVDKNGLKGLMLKSVD